jgi:hypothetical protein
MGVPSLDWQMHRLASELHGARKTRFPLTVDRLERGHHIALPEAIERQISVQ